MRRLLMLLMLAACTSTPPRTPAPVADPDAAAALEQLIAYSTTDFHEHGPAGTAQFRNVRGGYAPVEGGGRQYMLCGEFLHVREPGKAAWAAFATIKTTKYEQWLGGQTVHFCADPSARWLAGDLSDTLQRRLASLR